jgi:hypothetical protein
MGTSLLRSDVGEQLIRSVLSNGYSIGMKKIIPKITLELRLIQLLDEQFNASSSFPQDALGKRLEPYMLRLLSGGDLIPENPVLLTGTNYGLPSSVMADALITCQLRLRLIVHFPLISPSIFSQFCSLVSNC